MNSYLRAVAGIAYKDVLVEVRSRETVVAASLFALIAVVTIAFGLQLAPATARRVAPGLLWITLAFAGVLAFGRSFAAERDRGSLDGLLLAPIDVTAVYLGKTLAGLAFMVMVLAVALPAFTVLLGVPLLSWAVLPGAVLGLAAFAAAGTLFAAVALSGRSRDVLLPILFLPLAIPVILTALGATRQALDGAPGAAGSGALGVLAACTALYAAAGVLLFEYTVEE